MTKSKSKSQDVNPLTIVDRINRVTGVNGHGDAPRSINWQANPPYIGQGVVSLMRLLGSPAAIDVIESTVRKREVFKYFPAGANRYRLRVTIQNDVVVAWEGK